MRVTIALSALCTLLGCFGDHEDATGTQGRDLSLEGESTPSASEKPKHDTREADRPRTMGSTPCGPDDKWCPTPDPAMPVPGPDTTCCWNTAKQCYEFAKDPALCDALNEHCANLPAPPPPVDPGMSEYDACTTKAKDCYAWAKDPAECDRYRQSCDALLEPPVKPMPDVIEACSIRLSECYMAAGEYPEKCDELRKACNVLSMGPQ